MSPELRSITIQAFIEGNDVFMLAHSNPADQYCKHCALSQLIPIIVTMTRIEILTDTRNFKWAQRVYESKKILINI